MLEAACKSVNDIDKVLSSENVPIIPNMPPRGVQILRVIKSAYTMEDLDIDLPNAKLAYTIIQSLLDGHEALSDLLVLMSHAVDEDVLKAMTLTGEWEKYLESKRNMENVSVQIEKLTEELKRLGGEG